jgi:hypothetical protein
MKQEVYVYPDVSKAPSDKRLVEFWSQPVFVIDHLPTKGQWSRAIALRATAADRYVAAMQDTFSMRCFFLLSPKLIFCVEWAGPERGWQVVEDVSSFFIFEKWQDEATGKVEFDTVDAALFHATKDMLASDRQVGSTSNTVVNRAVKKALGAARMRYEGDDLKRRFGGVVAQMKRTDAPGSQRPPFLRTKRVTRGERGEITATEIGIHQHLRSQAKNLQAAQKGSETNPALESSSPVYFQSLRAWSTSSAIMPVEYQPKIKLPTTPTKVTITLTDGAIQEHTINAPFGTNTDDIRIALLAVFGPGEISTTTD